MVQQQPGCAELLSATVLQLWRCCARIYPGPILTAVGMQVTVLPVVGLCGAVLRQLPGPGPVVEPGGSSGSGARRRGSAARAVTALALDGPALLRTAANEALCVADKLAFCLFDEVRGRAVQRLKDLLQGARSAWLLTATAGCCAGGGLCATGCL